MKKIALAGVAAFVAAPAVPALAADVIVPVAPPVVVAPAPAPSWTGPYIGLHAGFGFGQETDNQSELYEIPIQPADEFPLRGFIGGLHAGYNFQSGALVFGLEGDVDYSRIRGGTEFEYDGGDVWGTLSFATDLQTSLRLRAGFAADSTLFYLTGGIAFARGTLTEDYHDEIEPEYDGIYADTQWHRGFTIGAGVEHLFTDSLSGRLEVRHTRFGTAGYDLDYDDPVNVNWHQTTITAGISLHF